MKIGMAQLPIKGAYELSAFSAKDERGSLSKYYEEEMGRLLNFKPAEVLTSVNRKNTIRGLHYQKPNAQHKIAWCTAGEIYEVLLDMRSQSPSFGKWHGIMLSEKRANGVFVPEGVAHGFASLSVGATILYVLGGSQVAGSERGVRFDDPALGIDWHVDKKDAIVSDKDLSLPLFKDAEKY
jgi:dTDP-4-dehydrorhamnose 3,5-epimerase